MRCTRCDRRAVPQGVGRTPDGVLAFGWCVDCLRETRCTEVTIATARRGGTRLPSYRALRRTPRSGTWPPEPRGGRAVGLVAASLAAWGLVLLGAGGWFLLHPRAGVASPFGNGAAVLLLAGGGATAVTALVLGLSALGRGPIRPRALLVALPWVALLGVLAVLFRALLGASPGRDPYLVLATALLLSAAGLARRLDGRPRPGARAPTHETARENRPKVGE